MRPAERSVKELALRWAVEDAGSIPPEVEDLAVVAKVSVRRSGAELRIESKEAFDLRRARAPGARQHCFVAARFRASRAAESELSRDEGAAADGKIAVWCGLAKDLVAVRMKGGGKVEGEETGICQRLAAVVEWEGGLKVESVASLPYSIK